MANKNLNEGSPDIAVAEAEHHEEGKTEAVKAPSAKKTGVPGRAAKAPAAAAAPVKGAGRSARETEKDEAQRFQRIVDNVTTAVMIVDRDFIVTYVNEATRQLLSKNATEFSKVWPDFDGKDISALASISSTRIPATSAAS